MGILKRLFGLEGLSGSQLTPEGPGRVYIGPDAVMCRHCGAPIRPDIEICRNCGKWRHKTGLFIAALIAIFISLMAAFAVFSGTF